MDRNIQQKRQSYFSPQLLSLRTEYKTQGVNFLDSETRLRFGLPTSQQKQEFGG